MYKTADRVFETSTSIGTGEYALAGAQVGFQPFSVLGAGNLCPYFATDDTDWEVGIGTVLTGPARLGRTHILASSNGGLAVDWGVGTKKIRCGPAASLDAPRTLTKDVAGGVGTTVLTQDEQRRQVLEFTGALTGNRVIEVDASPWNWIVRNNTTGPFTLTIRVTGQTGVAIPQGRRAHIFCDGSDVRGGAGVPGGSVSEFEAGTAVMFQQTTAPVGWTKDLTHNNKALRITTGTVGSGGATPFTTIFGSGKATANFTLTNTHIPNHSHSHTTFVAFNTPSSFHGFGNPGGSSGSVSTGATGGGGAHAHNVDLDVQYADVIRANKD